MMAWSLKPPGRNIDIEYRALAFDYHLRDRGLVSRATTHQSDAKLAKVFDALPRSPVTVFVPGHDAQVLAVHGLLAKRSRKRAPQASIRRAASNTAAAARPWSRGSRTDQWAIISSPNSRRR